MTGDGDIRRRARCDIAAVDAEGQPLNGLADEREIPGNRTHHARDGRRGRADADVAGGDRTVDRDAGRRIGVAGHQGLARRGRQRHIAARIRGSAGIDRLRKDLRAVINIDRRCIDLDIDGVAHRMRLGGGVEVTGIDHRMLGERDRIVGLDEIGRARAQRRNGVGDGRVRQRHTAIALARVTDDHIGRIDQKRAGLAFRRAEIDRDAAANVDDAVPAQLDQARIARFRAGIDHSTGLDRDVVAGLDQDATGVAGRARRAQFCILAELDAVAGRNSDAAGRRGLAARGQPFR